MLQNVYAFIKSFRQLYTHTHTKKLLNEIKILKWTP